MPAAGDGEKEAARHEIAGLFLRVPAERNHRALGQLELGGQGVGAVHHRLAPDAGHGVDAAAGAQMV
jgi:hypothetical protein